MASQFPYFPFTCANKTIRRCLPPPFFWVDLWFILTLGVEHLQKGERGKNIVCSLQSRSPSLLWQKTCPKNVQEQWYQTLNFPRLCPMEVSPFCSCRRSKLQATIWPKPESISAISLPGSSITSEWKLFFFANDWIKFHQVWPQPRQIEAKGREASSELSAIPRNTSDDND